MAAATWLRALVLGIVLGVIVIAVGGPTWAVALGALAGFLVVLLTFGLRN